MTDKLDLIQQRQEDLMTLIKESRKEFKDIYDKITELDKKLSNNSLQTEQMYKELYDKDGIVNKVNKASGGIITLYILIGITIPIILFLIKG